MLENKLLNHISTNFLDGDVEGLDAQTLLFDLNIVDSAAIFDLVDILKEETGADITMRDIHPGNFSSVAAMVDLVSRLSNTEEEEAT